MAITPVRQMVDEASAEIESLTPEEARRRVSDEGALVVDIRDIRELEREGVIEGSHHAPRGMLEFWVDPASPYHKPVFAEQREFILHCASGWRSALATKALQDMGLPRVSHIESGFAGWRKAGLPVVDLATAKERQQRSG